MSKTSSQNSPSMKDEVQENIINHITFQDEKTILTFDEFCRAVDILLQTKSDLYFIDRSAETFTVRIYCVSRDDIQSFMDEDRFEEMMRRYGECIKCRTERVDEIRSKIDSAIERLRKAYFKVMLDEDPRKTCNSCGDFSNEVKNTKYGTFCYMCWQTAIKPLNFFFSNGKRNN